MMQCTEPILHRMKTRPLKVDNFAAYPEEVGRLGASLPLVLESVDDASSRICSLLRAGGPKEPRGRVRFQWQELSATHPELNTEEKVALMKKKLAHRILASATAGGVRDVQTLKEQALRSLGGDFRLGEEQTNAPETV
jgi:hypothetical protein